MPFGGNGKIVVERHVPERSHDEERVAKHAAEAARWEKYLPKAHDQLWQLMAAAFCRQLKIPRETPEEQAKAMTALDAKWESVKESWKPSDKRPTAQLTARVYLGSRDDPVWLVEDEHAEDLPKEKNADHPHHRLTAGGMVSGGHKWREGGYLGAWQEDLHIVRPRYGGAEEFALIPDECKVLIFSDRKASGDGWWRVCLVVDNGRD